MALQDITNIGRGSSYKAAVVLENRFAPVVKKGVRIDSQTSRLEFPALRDSGATNIDLWLDGNMYPADPVTGKPPPFQTLKSYLEFLCHGNSGLLGYCNHLVSACDQVKGFQQQLEETQAHSLRKTLELQESIALLTEELNSSRAQGAEEIVMLKRESDLFKYRCAELEEELQRRQDGFEINLRIAKEQGRATADEDLLRLEQELLAARKALLKMQRKVERIANTPGGPQRRTSKSLANLSKTGGAARARIAKIRSLLQPEVVGNIQGQNTICNKRKRLCGDKDTQNETGQAIGQLLSKGETLAFISCSQNSDAATSMTNHYLNKIGEELGSEAILAACDMTGVSHKGYGEIFKTIKGRVQLVDKRLKPTFLPNPHKVRTCSKPWT